MRKILIALAALSTPAAAQITATLPVTCRPGGLQCEQAQPVSNPDGSLITPRGGASLTTRQVTVDTTATLVTAARAGRVRLVITQSAAGPCYYGPTTAVSASTGARLTAPGASKVYQYAGALYGVCPSGAVVTDVDEEY